MARKRSARRHTVHAHKRPVVLVATGLNAQTVVPAGTSFRAIGKPTVTVELWATEHSRRGFMHICARNGIDAVSLYRNEEKHPVPLYSVQGDRGRYSVWLVTLEGFTLEGIEEEESLWSTLSHPAVHEVYLGREGAVAYYGPGGPGAAA